MKSILLIAMLIPSFAFSADKVIETLKAENSMLKKRILQNNRLIKLRSNSSYKLEKKKIEKNVSKGANLALGLEAVNWGEYLEDFVPTVALSYTFHNNITLGASYGEFESTNFPVVQSLATISISQAYISYSINISEGFSFRPLVGYVNYSVDTNPEYFNDQEAQFGEFEIEGIENRSGSFTGFALVKDFGVKWNTTFRADLSKSASFFLGYRI